MSAVDDIAAYLAYLKTGGNSIDQIIFDELPNGEEMNATDELRRLLDERGVELRGGLPTETMVEADGLDLLYVALPDGRVRAFIRNYLTPEQAVEATLGSCNCSNSERTSDSDATSERQRDAVEVVRCRDCKHCMSYWKSDYCDYFAHVTNDPDGFCAWGERKED